MKRITMVAAAAALTVALNVPGAVAAKDQPKPKQIASALCVAEKQADKAAFKAAYGKNAMRNCKRVNTGEAGEIIANASQACRAEQDADPAGFAATYGTNANDKNAFGKCVSSKVAAEEPSAAEEFANAAQECRAERSADPAGFAAAYGTNDNDRNAFGKCVSSKAHDEEEPTPTA